MTVKPYRFGHHRDMPRDEHEIDARQRMVMATGIAMTSTAVLLIIVIALARVIEGEGCFIVRPVRVGSGGVVLVMLSYLTASRLRKKLAKRKAAGETSPNDASPPDADPRLLRIESHVLRHKGIMLGVMASSVAILFSGAGPGHWIADCKVTGAASTILILASFAGWVATPALRRRWQRRSHIDQAI